MHRITFYPLGNADCTCVELNTQTPGDLLLFDYANMRSASDSNDKRCDLPTLLRIKLRALKRNGFKVVAFTHLDEDHTLGASEFFEFLHAAKYQGDGRAKIETLWVTAQALLEEGATNDARVIQAEARHRWDKGEGIRVFARPAKLKEWSQKRGISFESRAHLVTDAGQMVEGYTKEAQGVEWFVHSPFAVRKDKFTVEDRNTHCLVLQGTFLVSNAWGQKHETRLFLGADIDSDVLSDIVGVTRAKGRPERLAFDVFKLVHHCSYKALNKDEKGVDKTEPVPNVKWLFEEPGIGQQNALLVSTSKPIPSDDPADGQPPHRQAANYYRERARALGGDFKVTMSHPTTAKPEPLVILIDHRGAEIEKNTQTGAGDITSVVAPRAGAKQGE